MKFTIEPGTSADIDELEKLYDELNDYLAATTNYPGWIKGVYPVREDAVAGVNDETLYVARYDGRIVGSVSTLLFLTNRVFDLPFLMLRETE